MAITDTRNTWRQWLWRDASNQIITVNFIVWVLLNAVMLLWRDHQALVLSLVSVPSQIEALPARCWTIFTYMFTQYDFMHMLVNMLWLMLFGRLMAFQIGEGKVWRCYIECGIAGSVVFVLATMADNVYMKGMLGSSCAVMGLIGMALVMIPRVRVDLLLFGHVRVVWIALVAILLFVVIEPDIFIQLAHLGGLLTGVILGLLKVHLRRIHAQQHPYTERELDYLLNKVGRSGYSSLSANERQKLFEMSQHLKNRR